MKKFAAIFAAITAAAMACAQAQSPVPPNIFLIEGEDFDSDGTANPQKGTAGLDVDVMPYNGGAYDGLGATVNVDYSRSAEASSDLYRLGEDPNVPMNDNLNGLLGADRGSWTTTVNFKLGWVGGGHWYNYTRNTAAGFYSAYGASSHGDANAVIGGRLGVVTSGVGTETQTVGNLGTFEGRAPGGWGNNALIPLAQGTNRLAFKLNGKSTLRFTVSNGDYDWFALVPLPGNDDAITLTVTDQPDPVSTIEQQPVSLSVVATARFGTDYLMAPVYQWQKNGTNIPGATAGTFSINRASVADSGKYRAVITIANTTKSATSAEADVVVLADTVPPKALSAVSMANGDDNTTEIGVLFDEQLAEAGAETPGNYTLGTGTVSKARYVSNASGVASLQSGVILTVAGLPAAGTTVTVKNVADAKGNAIPNTGQTIPVTSTAMKWISIGRDGAADGGRAFEPAAIATSATDYNLVSGGASFWNTSDDITFVYEQVSGDFDKKVRIAYADPSSQWSRNGLSVRASLNNGDETTDTAGANPASIYQNAHVNPPRMFNGNPSNNSWETNRRLLAGGATSGSGGGGTPDYPNAWARIKRVGQHVSMFRSNGGTDWVPLGTTVFNLVDDSGTTVSEEMPDQTFVGVFCGPENGNIVGIDATATREWANQMRDYGNTTVTQKPRGKQTYSIGLNFGANEGGSQLSPVDVVGANGVAQGNWNNLFGNTTETSGAVANIKAESNGTSANSTVTVEFLGSSGTWASTGRGEENNDFPALDANLMTGYLDTGNATTTDVTIANIPASLTGPGYDLVLYYLGGIAGDRGGAFSITDSAGVTLQDWVPALGGEVVPANAFVLNPAAPGSTNALRGNVIVFRNLKAGSLVLKASTADGRGLGGTPRAPINAIQLVTPSGLDVIGAPAAGPTISISGSSITFTGTLQAADQVKGTYADVPGAASPYPLPSGKTSQFFRSRN
ncbi:MAG: hypothetical protein ACKVYV_04785 [Limisphaerales bacterium]